MWTRIQRAWQRHGPLGFARLAVHNVRYFATHGWRAGAAVDPADREFDARFGTDTSDMREVGSLDVPSGNARHAVRYQPTDAGLFGRIMQALDVELDGYEFIDFGSGKGRVLLLASDYPFSRITGVEFSPELQAIAQRNIAIYDSPARRCREVATLCQDATQYAIPPKPLVCFFYNPFGAEVIRTVVANIEASLRAAPRDACVIYVDPVHRQAFEHSGSWRVLKTDKQYVIYRFVRPAGGGRVTPSPGAIS